MKNNGINIFDLSILTSGLSLLAPTAQILNHDILGVPCVKHNVNMDHSVEPQYISKDYDISISYHHPTTT